MDVGSTCRLSVRRYVNGITWTALVESESSFLFFSCLSSCIAFFALRCATAMYTVGNINIIAAVAVIGGGLFGFDISSMSAIIGISLSLSVQACRIVPTNNHRHPGV